MGQFLSYSGYKETSKLLPAQGLSKYIPYQQFELNFTHLENHLEENGNQPSSNSKAFVFFGVKAGCRDGRIMLSASSSKLPSIFPVLSNLSYIFPFYLSFLHSSFRFVYPRFPWFYFSLLFPSSLGITSLWMFPHSFSFCIQGNVVQSWSTSKTCPVQQISRLPLAIFWLGFNLYECSHQISRFMRAATIHQFLQSSLNDQRHHGEECVQVQITNFSFFSSTTLEGITWWEHYDNHLHQSLPHYEGFLCKKPCFHFSHLGIDLVKETSYIWPLQLCLNVWSRK